MRHSTFRQLEIFEAIARLGSFTRAADELHLTQPTVSMQMKKLSEAINAPLVEQVGKKVYLTDTGRALAQSAREIFGILDRFEMSLADQRGLKQGKLRLMAITTASYFAPRLLGEFAKLYPGIEVMLSVTNREQVLTHIAENLDDLYILGQPPEEIDVVAQPFMENPLVVVAPPDHPLAKNKAIPLSRLAQEPWLMREPGSGTRKAVERLFGEHHLEPNVRMELGANEAIKQAILAGLGISVLSRHSLALHAPGQFAILDAEGFPIRRQWYAVYPVGRQLSVVTRSFLDFLLTYGMSHDTDTN
ncbi:MAG: LysR family transcriptional regulator [Hydrogenophilaceae bacterium]|nr:LysR family transcriptional regulator [Hydrogenophilaceae bacterium]